MMSQTRWASWICWRECWVMRPVCTMLVWAQEVFSYRLWCPSGDGTVYRAAIPYHFLPCKLAPRCRVQAQCCQSPAASPETCTWYKCLVTESHPWSRHRDTRQGSGDLAVSFALKDLPKVTGALDVHVQRCTDAGHAYGRAPSRTSWVCLWLHSRTIRAKFRLFSSWSTFSKGLPIEEDRKAVSWSFWAMSASVLSCFSLVWFCATLWTVARQALLFMGFSRQEYWCGLPCPLPGELPDPGIEPVSLTSPAFSDRFFTTSATWEAVNLVEILGCLLQAGTLSGPIRKWQPTPEFLTGESHRQRSLAGYSPCGRKESDMTEQLNHNNSGSWPDAPHVYPAPLWMCTYLYWKWGDLTCSHC